MVSDEKPSAFFGKHFGLLTNPLQNVYATRGRRKGLMLIINNVNFNEEARKKGLERREGSNKDVENLQMTFGQFGFAFEIKDDLTAPVSTMQIFFFCFSNRCGGRGMSGAKGERTQILRSASQGVLSSPFWVRVPLRPDLHRTRDATRMQIGTFFL